MKLRDLQGFSTVTIQCHNNPDADTIAAGFGLYRYFHRAGMHVRLIYSGHYEIRKANLILMVERLDIPIQYVPAVGGAEKLEGLLLTVDCQYGEGNVTRFEADAVGVIDHHQIEGNDLEEVDMDLSEIRSNLGSCSTVVWSLLKEAGYPLEEDGQLATALYYGLFMDTGQFAEIYNPLDMDMRESLPFHKELFNLFRNSNISLKELEIAGIALLRYTYNEKYHYAVIKAQPCDPNILGIISDFLVQVDTVNTCVVYNEQENGYKLSVRSCVKEVRANEFASYITREIGSGGGHNEKAGGYIRKKLYQKYYPTLHSEAFFSKKINEYFDGTQIINALEYEVDIADMEMYQKKKIPLGFVRASDVLPVGTPIVIRTLEGDVNMVITPELYIMIGARGEVYPNSREKFEKSYRILPKKYCVDECAGRTEYIPTVKNQTDASTKVLTDYAGVCVATGETYIYVKKLEQRVKVFSRWDQAGYMLGEPGDFLAVRCDDSHDIYIIDKETFARTYEEKPSPKKLQGRHFIN